MGSSYAYSIFKIFNRWGIEIVSFDTPNFEWNWKDLSNSKLIEGVYFYKLEIQTGNKLKSQNGFFHIEE